MRVETILEDEDVSDWVETIRHSWESVRVNSDMCLTSRMRGECRLCAEACPTGALLLTDGDLRYDARECRACGVCAVSCPTGALDAFAPLTGPPLMSTRVLACASVARPGESACRCLAGVPPSLWPAAFSSAGPLLLTHGDCGTCSRPAEQMVMELPRRLDRLGHQLGRHVEVRLEQRDASPTQSNEPEPGQGYSRRQFFRWLGWGSHRAGAAAVGTGPVGRTVMSWVTDDTGTKAVGPERERFVRALRLMQKTTEREGAGLGPLPRDLREFDPSALAGSGSMARLHVDAPACTGCRSCALFCPTGALELEETGDYWRLTFSTARCTACGVCLSLCDPGALRLEWATLADTVGPPTTLIEAPVISCDDCGIAVPKPAVEDIAGRLYCRSCARRHGGGLLAL